MTTQISCVNPGIGCGTFIRNHKELVVKLKKFGTSVQLETWAFPICVCGGFHYRFTVQDTKTKQAIEELIREMGFSNESPFGKGKLLNNETLRPFGEEEIDDNEIY